MLQHLRIRTEHFERRASEIDARLREIERYGPQISLHTSFPGAGPDITSEIAYMNYARVSAIHRHDQQWYSFPQMVGGPGGVATHFGIVRLGELVFSGPIAPPIRIETGVTAQLDLRSADAWVHALLRDAEHELLIAERKLCNLVDSLLDDDQLATAERLMLYFGGLCGELDARRRG